MVSVTLRPPFPDGSLEPSPIEGYMRLFRGKSQWHLIYKTVSIPQSGYLGRDKKRNASSSRQSNAHRPTHSKSFNWLSHTISILIVNTSSIRSRDSSVGITDYEPHDQGIAVGFLSGPRDFFPLQSFQAGCEANPVFYSMGKVFPVRAIKIIEEWLWSTTPRVPI